MRFKSISLLALLAAQAQAANETPQIPQKVVVNGSQTDMDASRDAIAGKIVIGKQRIAESGVQNVGELLRREPAISIGKDGRLGLLGLPGYTQLLVDGLPPQGDALALDLMQIERIEIIKSTTAATGPIGIAGSINIVRRKAERKSLTQASVGASSTGGRLGANLSWLNNQIAAGSPFTYNMILSMRRSTTPAASHYFASRGTTASAQAPDYDGDSASASVFQSVLASSELAWTVAPGHKITVSPEASQFRFPRNGTEQRRWADGSSLSIGQDTGSTMTAWGLPVRWNWKIDADSSLSLRLAANGQRSNIDSSRQENWSNSAAHLYRNGLHFDSRNQFADLDFNTSLAGGHEISAGAKLARNMKDNDYLDSIDGQQNASLAALSTASTARMESGRLFLQDEWRIDKTLALNGGLSVERRLYEFNEGPVRNQADFNMWSPSVHLSKKISGDRKRQIRVSLARSFQPPAIDQMLLHPTVNRFAPCQPGKLCGANDIDTADRSGNPGLQPERALGLNVSYTHGIGADSELLLELYAREIQGKTGWEYALANVAWANTLRYVVRPVNLGQANVRGVNLEARVAGKDLSKDLSALEVHGSLGFARSELSDVPGPDNRIEGQLPWRLKFGGSYSLPQMPVKLGVEANVLPSDWVRDSVRQRIYQSSKTTLGVNGSWKIDAKSRLTVNLDNLLHKTGTRIEDYQSNAELLRQTARNADYARVSMKFDMTF